jgi:hypothetical protein
MQWVPFHRIKISTKVMDDGHLSRYSIFMNILNQKLAVIQEALNFQFGY